MRLAEWGVTGVLCGWHHGGYFYYILSNISLFGLGKGDLFLVYKFFWFRTACTALGHCEVDGASTRMGLGSGRGEDVWGQGDVVVGRSADEEAVSVSWTVLPGSAMART